MAIWFVGGGVALALLIRAPPGGGDAPLLDISESFVASVASNQFLKGGRPRTNKRKHSARGPQGELVCFSTPLAPSCSETLQVDVDYVYSHLCAEKFYFLVV